MCRGGDVELLCSGGDVVLLCLVEMLCCYVPRQHLTLSTFAV